VPVTDQHPKNVLPISVATWNLFIIFCHILHKYESLKILKNWEDLPTGFQHGGDFQNG
jgi:hypothetical protein